MTKPVLLTAMIAAVVLLTGSRFLAAQPPEKKRTRQDSVSDTSNVDGVKKLGKANTWLYVRTNPRGADVLVDGKRLGKSNGLFVVEPGVRRITIELDDHGSEGRKIVIKAGEIRRVELDLKRRPNDTGKFPHETPAARGKQPPRAPITIPGPVTFGPVIERVVNDDDRRLGNFLIDLDNGELISPQVNEMQKAGIGLEEWIIENGIDAVGETNTSVKGLIGVDMIAIPLASERWHAISPEDVRKAVALGKPGRPIHISGKGELPATYLFATREGGMGLLQIVGFVSEPRGVKIRYKMVQSAQHEDPQPKATSPSAKLDFRIAMTKEDFDDGRDIPDFQLPLDDSANSPPDGEYVWRKIKSKTPKNLVTEIRDGTTYVLLSNKPHEVMLAGDPGDRLWGLTQAAAVPATARGRCGVSMAFDEAGSRRIADLTKANLQKYLAVLVDDEAWMCPRISDAILGRANISGDFNQQEAEQLAEALRCGMVKTTGGRGEPVESSPNLPPLR